MITAISELNKYRERLNIVVKDLETLEDGKDADYSEIITDIHWIVHHLEARREQLQRRGKHI